MAIITHIRRCSLQIILFLFIFGLVIQWPVSQNMILNRLCVQNYNDSICRELNKHPEIQNEVQSLASQYMTMQSMATDIPGAIMALTLGAASDRIGRKPVMILPCFGAMLFAGVLLIQAMSVGIWWGYFVMGGLAIGSSGGMMLLMTAVTNYVTDTTPEEARTERLSTVMPFMGVGMILGIIASGMVSEVAAYVVCFLCSFTAFIVIYFFVDNIIVKQKEKVHGNLLYGLILNMKVGIQAIFSTNDPRRRRQLQVVIIAGMFSTGTFMAEGNLIMLYTKRLPFEWTPTIYGLYTALRQTAAIVGQVAGPILLFKLTQTRSIRNDYTLLQWSHIGFGAAAMVMGIVSSTSLLFFGSLVMALAGPEQPATGSIISRLVTPSEKGTFTAFSSFLSSLSVPAAAFVFNNIYGWSVKRGNPAFVFYCIAALRCVLFALIGFVKYEHDDHQDDIGDKKEK